MRFILAACLFAASVASITGCHNDDSLEPAPIKTAPARVTQSVLQKMNLYLRSTGTVHARETAIISAQTVGRIQQILVREGDHVRAGQTLVVLEDSAMRISVEQAHATASAAQNQQAAAQAEANLAASTLERYRQLEVQKSVSSQEMDEVTRRSQAASARLDATKGETEAARAQERNARTMLGYARLVAPFAGVVTARLADTGSLASPGVPLLQVDQAGALQLLTTVDESAINSVQKGMHVKVSNEVQGTVGEILPAADPSSHSFVVKIDLPSTSNLRAGMYATAEIANGTRQAILIPRSAIVLRGSLPCAYVIDSQGIAQLRSVTIGALDDENVEVLSGISANERIVDAPADRDLAGKRIEVRP